MHHAILAIVLPRVGCELSRELPATGVYIVSLVQGLVKIFGRT
jgi:hypothetical protein